MKNLVKQNKVSIILALVHVCISFFTDAFAFNYHENFSGNVIINFIIFKILMLMSMIFFYRLIIILVEKIKEKDEMFLAQFRIGIIYFSIMCVFLFLTWPGVWRWDEFIILEQNYTLQLDF